MGDVATHLMFLGVCAGAILFLLGMRHRLMAQYPDDESKQMQSMLGFMRSMAIFATIVLGVVLADLLRVLLRG